MAACRSLANVGKLIYKLVKYLDIHYSCYLLCRAQPKLRYVKFVGSKSEHIRK